MNHDELSRIRERLDEVDGRILQALADRHHLVKETADLKVESSPFIRDPKREEALIERLRIRARDLGLDSFHVAELYREILKHSVRFQTGHFVHHSNPDRTREVLRVTYQGTDGAYSHLATRKHFSHRTRRLESLGMVSFRTALEVVEHGDADYALVPIENTTAGSINEVYDLLTEMNLSVVGEEILHIDHCLLALEKVSPEHIRRISSHPQAIAQCSRFLRSLTDCRIESTLDTAMSARSLIEENDLSRAAIASAEAAEIYGLQVVKAHIANQEQNYTRFLVTARDPMHCDLRLAAKTSMVFATEHRQGALAKILDVLAEHDLSMTKLESRPRYHSPWSYLFYVDFLGNLADPTVDHALSTIEPLTSHLRVLGSYPVAEDNPVNSNLVNS